MTMPVERTRSVVQTRDFLRELSKSSLIPESFRDEAARLLRHYPEPQLLFHAAHLDEIIHSTEPGDPRRELAISGYPALFSESLDE
ncbi:BPSL0761 family protein [Pseudomonas viridiflava]|uniref:BPSL0761 family protein n=1 Tax=Pseudomonas viridiflava TaxID=33069 RepID=UPI0013CEF5A5|nr:BPSL0761 family protein [Pseudomonas viridiflava]